MIVRIVLALFISLVSGMCYMTGLTKLMSGLLIGFGALSALFFGIVFLLPPGSEKITFAVTAPGSSWPFFLLALILIALIGFLFLYKPKNKEVGAFEQFGARHLQLFGGGILLYLVSLFLPIALWFPADNANSGPGGKPEIMLLIGVLIFISGASAALYLIYRATRGGTGVNPNLMRRLVPALFSVFHFDKIPALVAYLLIYSEQPELVFSKIAALALAAYIPVSLLLIKISFDVEPDIK